MDHLSSPVQVARTRPRSTSVKQIVTASGPSIALVVLVAIFSFTNENFLTPGNLGSIADQSSILIVIAMGMTFVGSSQSRV